MIDQKPTRSFPRSSSTGETDNLKAVSTSLLKMCTCCRESGGQVGRASAGKPTLQPDTSQGSFRHNLATPYQFVICDLRETHLRDGMRSLLLLIVIAAGLHATGAVLAEEIRDDQAHMDARSRHSLITSNPCSSSGKPPYPKPSGDADEYIVTNCNETNIQAALLQMNFNKRGSLYLYCRHHATIFTDETWQLAGGGKYRIVADGRIILNGGGLRQILSIGGAASVELYGIRFWQGMVKDRYGGGAVLSGWKSSLTVVDCVFRGNRAISEKIFGGGAAIRVLGGSVVIWYSLFEDNRASSGGAVQVTSGNVQIYNSAFRGNFAVGGTVSNILAASGGAVRSDRVSKSGPLPVVICGCDFEANSIVGKVNAGDAGGVIEIFGFAGQLPSNNQSASLIQTNFFRNGGSGQVSNVVFVHGAGKANFVDVGFFGNQATSETLGIGKKLGYLVTFTDVVFKYNSVRALTLNDAQCAMSNVTDNGEKIACDALLGVPCT